MEALVLLFWWLYAMTYHINNIAEASAHILGKENNNKIAIAHIWVWLWKRTNAPRVYV